MRRLGKGVGVGLLAIAVTGMTVWGMGALYYSPLPTPLRVGLAAAFGLATVGAFLGLSHRRRTLLGFVLVWGVLVGWWSTITPSNDRDWQPDVAVLPWATVDGDRVTVHNIRNIAYRTATDFTPRYYDKTFDLRRLDSADLISPYWAGEAIAHLFGSFGFGGQEYVAISAKTRKERTEDYSTFKGFSKQYELFYVVADERDVIRLRTTYRQPHEDVYLYRTRVPPAQARRLFLDYVRDINRLVEQPAFYNTLTTNCTTAILFHARASGGIARYNWKVLLSGYAPAYAYEIGRLDTRLPFAELKRLSHINARAQAAGDAADFSQRIRAGLPMPPEPGGEPVETSNRMAWLYSWGSWRQRMHSSFQSFFQVIVLLTFLLVPGGLAAQGLQGAPSPAAATAPPPRVPELAEIIPLATAVSGRLPSLERAMAEGMALSWVEQQLRDISARVDEYAAQFLALHTATGPQAGRLLQLKAAIKSADASLAGVSTFVAEKVRTLGNRRKTWLAEQQQWNAWQAALLQDEPLEHITTTVTRTQGAIETALGLLRQQLSPLLALQEHAGTLHTRITTLTAEAEGLLSLTPGGILADASPAMFSAQYFAQVAAALRTGVHTGLVQITWPDKSFFARHGGIMVLQGVLSLLLALVFVHYRPQLQQVEHWRFVARRPLAAGLVVGVLSGLVFYESPPDMVRLALSVLVGTAFVRLLGGLMEGGWRWQLVYGLLILSILTNLFYVLGLPLALFRLYILVAALVSLLCCLRWAAASRRLREARLYAWGLRLAAVVLAVVLCAEIWGEAKLAEFLFVSVLRTLGIVLVFGLLRYLVRGGLEWAVHSVSRHAALLGRNTALVVQRLAWLGDVLIGVVLLSALLMTWQVYDNPAEAITGLLSVHATIGSQQLTIGLVLLALAALGVSYLASWMLQTLLTENVLARRHVDIGVSTSISRLLHYALVSAGFVLALVLLGVDLTQMTLLVSALGVGIGFGLQTIVNNFVCGLILLLERPLRVGDTIELGGQLAKIAKIGLRSTTVRTGDQADVIVPNTELITNQVTNWTLTNRQAPSLIPVGVAYGSDIALVMQTLKECALAHPGVLHSPEPRVLFRRFGDSALDFELCAWVADLDTRGQVASDLHQDIDRRFRQAGIEIPFPQRDLHVRSVEHANTMAAIVQAPPD